MVWYKLKSTKARTLIECVLQNGFLDLVLFLFFFIIIIAECMFDDRIVNDDYVIAVVYIYAS